MRFAFALLLCATVARAAVPAPPLAEAAEARRAGLTLTFTAADGKTDTRTARLVALFVAAGDAPTPFLLADAFVAKWEGDLTAALRAEYTFLAESSPGLKLTINGAPVLDDASAKAGLLVKLNKGANHLVAELPRAAAGDTFLRLKWKSREFPAEPVPPTVFTHDANAPALRTADRVREGRLLFAELRCSACHDARGVLPARGEGMPELMQDAPVFDEIGAKYREPWLAHWISDPHSIRPHALMPRVFATQPGEVTQKAADLAAYFTATNPPPQAQPIDDQLIPEGGALFANLGCIACHSKPDIEQPDERDRVPLGQVKGKWLPSALEAWLKNPAKNYQWNRMPHFRLSDAEATRLTAYLVGRANHAFPSNLKGDAANGGALLITAGCLNCHAGVPPSTAPQLAATLDHGWTAGCVADDMAARGKAPDFVLSATQREALRAFASVGFAALKQEVPAEFAERQIKHQRCTACHARDAEQSVWSQLEDEIAPLQAGAPLEEGEGKPIFSTALPPLTWSGEKLRTEYAAEFIAGHGGDKPRPWLIARMPGFAAPAAEIAAGLAQQHGFPPAEPALIPDLGLAAIGETLLGENGGFNCTTCHGIGDKPGTAVFEAPGINLTLSRARLRHDYYLRWVLNPQRIDPDTKMPRFADDDGKTPLTDALDGDAATQFEAVWHFIQSLKK